MTTSLVVAIEPDREQAARLSGIVRGRLGAQLVLAESAARALDTLGDRIPDLILTPALLPARDEAALAGRLRERGSAAAHVQTITLPRIGGVVANRAAAGMFARFRRSRPAPLTPEGCDPDVFTQQVSAYLQRAQTDRVSTSSLAAEESAQMIDEAVVPAVDEMVVPAFAEVVVPAVEETVMALVEEFVEPPSVVEQPIEPAPMQMPVAAVPAIDPIFSVEDMDLQFWIADEPEPAPDLDDIDMSALLEGLVLPARSVAIVGAPIEPPAPATPEPAPVPTPRRALKRHVPIHDHAPMEPTLPRLHAKAPIQDEWGLFDPEQCGFAALVAKLDAVTEDEDVEKRQGTSARVISYN